MVRMSWVFPPPPFLPYNFYLFPLGIVHHVSTLLQQLVADLNSASLSGEPMDRNEAVKQLLEHVVTLKLVSNGEGRGRWEGRGGAGGRGGEGQVGGWKKGEGNEGREGRGRE